MTSTAPMKGSLFNHSGFRVNDLETSVKFYTEAFGMQQLARFDSDTVSIAQMGYEHSAKEPGTPFLKREGVLELVHAKVCQAVQKYAVICR